MNLEIKKFLSDENIADLVQSHPLLFKAKGFEDSWNFIFAYLKEWKSDPALFDQAIRFKEFFDFFNIALPLASKGELELFRGLFVGKSGEEPPKFQSLLGSRVERCLTVERAKESPFPLGDKIQIKLLLSYGERLDAKLVKLKEVRDKGKSGLILLKKNIQSGAKDPANKLRAANQKKQFAVLGEKVLKACDLVLEKKRKKMAIEEIRCCYENVEKALLERGGILQEAIPALEEDIRKTDKRFFRIESLWEKTNEILVEISMEEEWLEKTREIILNRRETNRKYIKLVENFKNRVSQKNIESREIDEMLGRLHGSPILIPLCKERISKNRRSLISEQKFARKLSAIFKSIKKKRNYHLERYDALLSALLNLQANKSFHLIALAKITKSNRSKIEAASKKNMTALLRIASALIVLDRFIVPNPILAKSLGQNLSVLEKMAAQLKKLGKGLREWENTFKNFKEKDIFHVPVKPETLIEAADRDSAFDICLSPDVDQKTVARLLTRNYEQEKEVSELELANISKIISDEAPEPSVVDALLTEESSSSQENRKRNFLVLKIIQWRRKRRRRRDKARRMEYPQTGKPPLSRRVLAVLIPMMGLGYYSNPVAHVDERKIADDLKSEPMLQELYREEQPQTDLQLNKIIHALMYGQEKVTASPDIKLDQKKQWEIFAPVFENFSLHWANGDNGPILINKNGRAPGAQSPEAFKLFEEIKKKMDPEYSGFFSRLYLNLLDLGAAPKEAAKFIIAMETSSPAFPRDKGVKMFYEGQNLPINELEKMNFKEFVKSISPYIVEKYSIFSKSLGMQIPDDLPEYARMLSEDIFHCARILGVPLTSMVTIAHHETYFMNIFGDGSRSVGPFQLFEPTRELIENDLKDAGLKMHGRIRRLEDHITLSTFMATFHFATLMKRFSYFEKDPSGEKIKRIVVDLDKSLKLYNGHSTYPHKVFQKSQLLKYYLNARKDVYARASNFLM